MENLLSARYVRLIVCMLVWHALRAQPQKEPEFCALRITVLADDGLPARGPLPIPIRIVASKDGSVWRTFETRQGKVEVCDVEPEPFDVVVGRDGIGQVVVRQVRVFWMRTVDLHVMLDSFSGYGESLPWNGCYFLVKVRDSYGQPVPTSVVTEKGKPDRATDSYGRIALSVRAGATSTVIVKSAGFRETESTLSCPEGYRDNRLMITLLPDAGKAGNPAK